MYDEVVGAIVWNFYDNEEVVDGPGLLSRELVVGLSNTIGDISEELETKFTKAMNELLETASSTKIT